MNEEDLNGALHDLMVRSTPPPSMDPASAVERGHRARKRRTAKLTGVAAVTLAAGVGLGPALVANFPGNATADPASGTNATVAPTITRKSGDPWPEGQVDRTAYSGPRAERADKLMEDLSSAVPPGLSASDVTYPDGRTMRWSQAQYASADGEPSYWEYQAIIAVRKGDRVGRLVVQSTTPSGKAAMEPCKLAQTFSYGTGACTVVDVNGKKVGVVTKGSGSDFDQWAAYRYTDGTVVFLGQVKDGDRDNANRPPLTQQPFTIRQLAEAVLSPQFKIST